MKTDTIWRNLSIKERYAIAKGRKKNKKEPQIWKEWEALPVSTQRKRILAYKKIRG